MYTMMQVCRELDMTYQTLKYYCNEGLIPGVKRDENNRRIFDEKDVKVQDEEVAGFEIATVEQIKAYAKQGIFLHYDSIRQVFED